MAVSERYYCVLRLWATLLLIILDDTPRHASPTSAPSKLFTPKAMMSFCYFDALLRSLAD